METSDRPPGWLTWEELSACLSAKGVDDIPVRRLERWREEGVFPPVLNVTSKFHGSVTYYPPGSCEQGLEVRKQLLENRKFEYVIWELWWRGFWVGEFQRKSMLEQKAKQLDKYLAFVRQEIAKDENSNSDKSIFDVVAKLNSANIALSRIHRRVELKNLATVFRVILETATGDFRGFEPDPHPDTRSENELIAGIKSKSADEIQLLKALDFGQSEKDSIRGQKVNFTGALLPMLRDISKSLRIGKLVDVLQYPEIEIEKARDDVRNALRIAPAFHDAVGWIYGPNAFGLRFMAWFAKKLGRGPKATWVLIWVKLRRVSVDLYPSPEIALLANQAETIRDQSLRLREFAKNDPRFASVFAAKRIRAALKDEISFRRFIKEIQAATMS